MPEIVAVLGLDLAEHFHLASTADHTYALTIVCRVATFEQEDRIAERCYRRDTPTAGAPVNDVLRAVGIEANNLTDIRKRSIDPLTLVGRNAPNPRCSSRVPDLRFNQLAVDSSH